MSKLNSNMKIEKTLLATIIVCFILLTHIITASAFVGFKGNNEEEIVNKYKLYSTGWSQISGDGFGSSLNSATRGMAIYNNELYIGTTNLDLDKVFNIEKFDLNELIELIIEENQQSFPTGYYLQNSQMISLEEQILLNIAQQEKTNTENTILNQGQEIDNANEKINNVDFTGSSNTPSTPITLPNIFTIIFHLLSKSSNGCEIWKYNHTTKTLSQVVGENSIVGMNSGFNYKYNFDASVMEVFNGKLYVGTWNTGLGSLGNPSRKGCEIWRFDGETWEQVVGHNQPIKGGFGNCNNIGAWSIKEFNGYLYIGTMHWGYNNNAGCQIWRSQDGEDWEKVVDRGFKPFMSQQDLNNLVSNSYAWCMEEYQGKLYVGTFNSRMFCFRGWGGQLWQTEDGVDWDKISLPGGDGFGEKQNYGIRKMAIYNNELYVGLAASILHDEGLEIWKFDGSDWDCVIGDNIQGTQPGDVLYDGFGDSLNKYVWSMCPTSDNKLFVGTGNVKLYLNLNYDHEGCEVWCLEDDSVKPIVKSFTNPPAEKDSGFGSVTNIGARSMIEYPVGSGNIVIGTLKFEGIGEPQKGCELWIRT